LNAEDYKNPKAYQAGLGIERQVSESMSVGADFTYVNTVHLQRNRDLNLPLPILRSTTVDPAQRPFFGVRSPVTQQRPISSLGSITVRESTARSLYRALTLRTKFQKKWGQFNAFYTLSKNVGNDDNERDATGFRYENAFNLEPEFADSNIDRRHQFVMSPVFFLPHGFDISSAVRMFSGVPVDASSGITDANGDLGGPDRPYLGPGVPFKRNAFRNKAFYGFDVHGSKHFYFAVSNRLVFSVDIFNIFNLHNIHLTGTSTTFCTGSPVPANCGFLGATNPNWLQVRDQNLTSSRLGNLLLTNNPGPPFQVQFGARFQF